VSVDGTWLLLTPTGLDFGDVQVGETSAQQMTHITNIGTSAVTIAMTGGAPDAPSFGAFQNCQGVTLQPGESCQIIYSFTPAAVGLATATSSFTLNGQPFSVRLERARACRRRSSASSSCLR